MPINIFRVVNLNGLEYDISQVLMIGKEHLLIRKRSTLFFSKMDYKY
jgi:hypothetical protein